MELVFWAGPVLSLHPIQPFLYKVTFSAVHRLKHFVALLYLLLGPFSAHKIESSTEIIIF